MVDFYLSQAKRKKNNNIVVLGSLALVIIIRNLSVFIHGRKISIGQIDQFQTKPQ